MVEFTNQELGLILTVLAKADPMELVADVQIIRRKIITYAEEHNARIAQAQQEGTKGQESPFDSSTLLPPDLIAPNGRGRRALRS